MEHFYDDQFRVQYLGGKKKETKKKLKFECQEIMGLFKIEDLAEEPRKYKDTGISLFKDKDSVCFRSSRSNDFSDLSLFSPLLNPNSFLITV